MDRAALDSLAAVAVALSNRVVIYRDVITDLKSPPLQRIYRGTYIAVTSTDPNHDPNHKETR
jgi:hypothetical protein